MDPGKKRTGRERKKKLIIAIYADVFNDQKKTKNYPVQAIDGTILNNNEDLEKWFANWNEQYPGIYYADFSASVAQWNFIYDNNIKEWLMRYKLHNKNNIHSFASLFEDLPAKWVDLISFIGDIHQIATDEYIKERKIYGN